MKYTKFGLMLLLLASVAVAGIVPPPVNQASVAVTGGTINGTTVGATTRATGAFTTLGANALTTITGTSGTIATVRGTTAADSNFIVGNSIGDMVFRALAGGDAIIYSDTGRAFQLGSNGAIARISMASAGGVTITSSLSVGAGALTLTTGAVGLSRITASGTAPGAGGGKLELVCGTNAGTAKLVIAAGTSATALTVLDNIGAGVSGC